MSGKGGRKMTRRKILQTGAGIAAGGALQAESAAGESYLGPPGPTTGGPWYDHIGVKRVINAAGTFTALGGSVMSPEVVAAWVDASKYFVDLLDLQEKVGARIAKLVGVE